MHTNTTKLALSVVTFVVFIPTFSTLWTKDGIKYLLVCVCAGLTSRTVYDVFP